MKNLLRIFAILICVAMTACSAEQGQVPAETTPKTSSTSPGDLADLLDAGTLSIVRANGNGSSSGASMEGVIRNSSSSSVAVDIVMSRPVYFRNSGRGQNMIGSMLFRGDGSYSKDGDKAFISLGPNEQSDVRFVAYCADFEKDNPSQSESFSIENAPPQLAHVMSRIAAHSRANPNTDITVAAQVAVWLAQGVEVEEISTKFPFTASDELLARTFLE